MLATLAPSSRLAPYKIEGDSKYFSGKYLESRLKNTCNLLIYCINIKGALFLCTTANIFFIKMVRTSGGIRISAGKSSKKSGGGGGVSSAGSRSTPAASSNKGGSSRLPPIPHCEAPSWQKPITNFFNAGASSSKVTDTEIIETNQENSKNNTVTEDKCNTGQDNILVNKVGDNSITAEDIEPDHIIEDKVEIEKENKEEQNNTNDDDEEPQIKKQKKEEDKENENINSK